MRSGAEGFDVHERPTGARAGLVEVTAVEEEVEPVADAHAMPPVVAVGVAIVERPIVWRLGDVVALAQLPGIALSAQALEVVELQMMRGVADVDRVAPVTSHRRRLRAGERLEAEVVDLHVVGDELRRAARAEGQDVTELLGDG